MQDPRTSWVWAAFHQFCPACGEYILRLAELSPTDDSVIEARTVWPKSIVRPVPPEVEEPYAGDFREASATLSVSPKASAALSRRVLQAIIRDKAGIKEANLNAEIDAVAPTVPSWLSDDLHAVRAVGNFAAHPTKSTNTGDVVDVEPGEAEFLLNVLERMFDFYFVQPVKSQAERNAISAKLADAGKPPLKT